MIRALRLLLLALAAAILAAVGLALATVHPRFFFGTLVGDDAGYYLTIARNFCTGHGLSFDRLRPTNGFNPLMTLLLIPLDRLFSRGYDLVACFRIGALVTWVGVVWGWRSLHGLSARVLEAYAFPGEARPLALAAMAFFYAGFVALKGYYGMDAFLVLPLGLFYLERVSRHGLLAPGRGPAIIDGALLGALVLARVDSAPLALAAFAWMLPLARTRRGATAAFAARLAAFLALVAPYLAWNRIEFGDWLPISARLKSSFPRLDLALSMNTVLHTSLNPADRVVLFVALAAAAAWLVVVAARDRRAADQHPGPRQAMAVCALYVVGRLAWLLSFSRLDVQGSYFVLAHPFVALSVFVLAARLGGSRAALPAGIALVLVTLVLAAGKGFTAIPEMRAVAAGRGDEWVIGRRLHDAVTDRDVLYGGAYGLIGFVTDRPWVNGDGVANDRAYQDAIAHGQLSARLTQQGVTHLVITITPPHEPGPEPIVQHIMSTLHGVSDTLWAAPGDIVLRERMRRNGGTDLWLVRWPRRGTAMGR